MGKRHSQPRRPKTKSPKQTAQVPGDNNVDPGDPQPTPGVEGLVHYFRYGAVAVFSGVVAAPVYYLIEGDMRRLVISSGAAFLLLLLVAVLRHAPALRNPRWGPTSEAPANQDPGLAHIAGLVVANGLTASRPLLGALAGYHIGTGRVAQGFLFYLSALTTDVLDGLVARSFEAQTKRGGDWDAAADVSMNFAFGLGLAWLAIQPPIDRLRIASIIGMGIIFALSRFLIHVHSIADKLLSGFWRLALFGLAFPLLPSEWRVGAAAAGTVLLLVGGTYELAVLRADRRNNRPWM